jgi:hypothetical protein
LFEDPKELLKKRKAKKQTESPKLKPKVQPELAPKKRKLEDMADEG